MTAIVTAAEVLTPFGLGLEKNFECLKENGCAISAIHEDFGSDFPVPYAGQLDWTQLTKIKNGHCRLNHVIGELIKALAPKISGLKIDRVLIATAGSPVLEFLDQPDSISASDWLQNAFDESQIDFETYDIVVDKKDIVFVNNTCSSGLMLLAYAKQCVDRGMSNVLCISVDLIDKMRMAYLSRLGALSKQPVAPSYACRPFNRDRQGFVKSDGCAIALVQSGAADRAGDGLVEIKSFGHTSDAYRLTDGREDGEGGYQAMKVALQTAKISLTDISFIKCHGTGTKLNDLHEALAITRLSKEMAFSPLTALKGHLGHSTDASGLVESLLAATAFKKGVILPIKNLSDPEFSLPFVRSLTTASGSLFLSNSFGFGGNNLSMVFRII